MSTAKYCSACEDLFEPKVTKIAKYCSADCAYEHAGKNVEWCTGCGDDFDIKFTKTFIGCSEECDKALGIKLLAHIGAWVHGEALILITEKMIELTGVLCKS